MIDSFPVLTIVSKLLRFLGWLLIIVGLFYFVAWEAVIEPHLPQHSFGQEDLFQLIAGIAATLLGLVAIVIGESVGVLFAIEANTRKTAASLASHSSQLIEPKN